MLLVGLAAYGRLPAQLPSHWNVNGQVDGTMRLFINAIVLFMALLYGAMIAVGLGWPVEVPRLITVGVGLLFLVLGNEMGRLKPNWFIGIRTPWTLADPEVWRSTHRVGGRVFFAFGLVMIVAGLLLPLPASAYIVIVGAIAIALFSFGYSYLLWRQRAA
jgi:uncharacterized membrane protein